MQKTIKQRFGAWVINALPVTRENFDIFRFELNAFRVRTACNLNPFKTGKIKKLTRPDDLSVNIGAGPFGEEGWVNIDMFSATNISFTYDCRKKLPFRNNSVARIRCEHMLEHLDRREEVPMFLKECFRSLKEGGVLRIVVPDVSLFIKAYYENTDQSWGELGINKANFNKDWMQMDMLNKIFRQAGEHKFGYDFDTLKISLEMAGFTSIHRASFGNSLDALLVKDQENHSLQSLYVEARK